MSVINYFIDTDILIPVEFVALLHNILSTKYSQYLRFHPLPSMFNVITII